MLYCHTPRGAILFACYDAESAADTQQHAEYVLGWPCWSVG